MQQARDSQGLVPLDVRQHLFRHRRGIRAASVVSPASTLSQANTTRHVDSNDANVEETTREGKGHFSSMMEEGDERCGDKKRIGAAMKTSPPGNSPPRQRRSMCKPVVPVEMERMVGTLRKSNASPTLNEVLDLISQSFSDRPRPGLEDDLVMSPSKAEEELLRTTQLKKITSLMPTENQPVNVSFIPSTSQIIPDAYPQDTASPVSSPTEFQLYSTQLEEHPLTGHHDNDNQIIGQHDLTDFDSFESTHTMEQSPGAVSHPIEPAGTPGLKANRRYFTPVTPEAAYEGLGIHRPKSQRTVWVSVLLIFLAAIVTAGILTTIVIFAAEHGTNIMHKTKTVDLTDSSVLSDQKGTSIAIEMQYPSLTYTEGYGDKKSSVYKARAYDIAKEFDERFYSSGNKQLIRFYFYTEVIALKRSSEGGTLVDIAIVFKKDTPDSVIIDVTALLQSIS